MSKVGTHSATLRLRLYISGNAPNSVSALANLAAICRVHFASGHELEVVDLLEHPERAAADSVIVTPTLLKLFPKPPCRVVGDLSDTHQVVLALGRL